MWDLSVFLHAEAWVAVVTLTALETVLGIDNLVFISIMTDRLPESQRARARSLGLIGALGMRVGLLLAINWIMGLTATLFTVAEVDISGRDLILGIGGLFLILKATMEIFEQIELDPEEAHKSRKGAASFGSVVAQIVVLDVVFSLDSVITAVGMANDLPVMVAAIVIAVLIMLAVAGKISGFINANPSMKVLALSFLLLIGVVLVADSIDQHVNKTTIYFAMAFALSVELVNLRIRKKHRRAGEA